MNKKNKIQELTVNIYELGMIRRDIEKWSPYIDLGNEEVKNICTHLSVITNDNEISFDNLIGKNFEDARNFLIKKHYEYLNKFREELISL